MEFCSGGQLFDHIAMSGAFTEPQAAIVIEQLVRAVSYLHANQVCHRDLKPEHLLFVNTAGIERYILIIIGFG